MEFRRTAARYTMALLHWCEFGRSLAMPGLTHDRKFRKHEASTWEMGKLPWRKYSASNVSIVP
jgi:hypothetical protein